jgi:hypothetical protein
MIESVTITTHIDIPILPRRVHQPLITLQRLVLLPPLLGLGNPLLPIPNLRHARQPEEPETCAHAKDIEVSETEDVGCFVF